MIEVKVHVLVTTTKSKKIKEYLLFYLLLKSVIFLKSDGQQFHNLQQSEQPPLIIEHQKRLRHISLEIPLYTKHFYLMFK
jgi:hypothetical protein